MGKKQTLIFVCVLIVFFFVLDLFMQSSKKAEPPKEDKSIRIISNPISMNTKESDYRNGINSPAQTQTNNPPIKVIADNQEQTLEADIDYSTYLGNWLYGEKTTSINDVKRSGGIIVEFTSFDSTLQIITGIITIIQESPINETSFIEIESKVNDGALYFEFTNDGFNRSGNGVITLSNNTARLSLSTLLSSEDLDKKPLFDGLFQLKKVNN